MFPGPPTATPSGRVGDDKKPGHFKDTRARGVGCSFDGLISILAGQNLSDFELSRLSGKLGGLVRGGKVISSGEWVGYSDSKKHQTGRRSPFSTWTEPSKPSLNVGSVVC